MSSLSSGSGVSIFFSGTFNTTSIKWQRIVDLGGANSPPSNNIVIAQLSNTNTLLFQVFAKTAATPCGEISIPAAITVGTPLSFLFTLASNGTLTAWSDGSLVTGQSLNGCPLGVVSGLSLSSMTFAHSYIGRSNWGGDYLFQGSITDLRIWNQVVDWNQAQGTWER